jgi:hypothetical protein
MSVFSFGWTFCGGELYDLFLPDPEDADEPLPTKS